MYSVKNNEKNYRPIPFYFVNTTEKELLTQEKTDAAVKRLADLHFGGILLFNKPPDGFTAEGYLSEAWFEMTEHFVLSCLKYRMELWINDGFNFPPGDAGGRIAKAAPWLKQQYVILNDREEVEIREADWGFPAFEDPESSRLFIEFVYEEYKKRLGKYFGCGIKGFFSDADNRRVNHFTKGLLGGKAYFPWCRNFTDIFLNICHYDITPYLHRLLKGEKGTFSRDYWYVAGRIYQQWFANNCNWCKANGLQYSFHSSDTGPFTRECMPRSSIYTEGDIFEIMKFSSCPGTDHELLRLDGGTHYDDRFYIPDSPYGQVYAAKKDFADTAKDVRAKYIASAARLLGRDRTLCEAYAATNWGVSFNDLRRITSWQIMQGINFFVPHAVHHVAGGNAKYFAPPEFSQSTLSVGVMQFNDFIAQKCAEASSGEYVAPVAVVDTTYDIWQGTTDGKRLFEICDRLNRQGWGYCIVPRSFAKDYKWVFDPAADAGSDPELPPAPAVFKGNGDLHFMLRKEDSGKLKVLLANIWSDEEIKGTLEFCGREYPVAVASGDIVVVREGDGVCGFGDITENTVKPVCTAVELLDEHFIPLRDLSRWQLSEDVPQLKLLVPERWAGKVVLNGISMMPQKEDLAIGADIYKVFAHPAAAGEYELSLPEGLPEAEYPVYLAGDITAKVSAAVTEIVFMYQYNVNLMSAAGAKLEISRGHKVKTGLLREQGYPFYSGRVKYTLEYPVDGENILYFDKAYHTVKVYVSGEETGTVIFDGTVVKMPVGWNGTVELIQYNAWGNQLEGAAYDNGMVTFPVCIVK